MIELTHVSYAYPGASDDALHDVSLRLRVREHVALVGANGSGKSTLARLLNGSRLPSYGDVYVEGASTRQSSALQKVGFVRQDPRSQLVSSVVWDEVAFGPCNLGLDADEVSRRVAQALKTCGLEGYEDRSIESLSGGEQQRVALAGVLAMDPDYLVLDEVDSQLDGAARASLRTVLAGLRALGVGILEITHLFEEVLQADRVVVMRGGSVFWTGTPNELLLDEGALEASGLSEDPVAHVLAPVASAGLRLVRDMDPRRIVAFAAEKDILPELSRAVEDVLPHPRNRVAADPRLSLELRDVSVAYDGGSGLEDVSIAFRPGRVTLLGGVSGSGKSTAACVGAGVLRPTAGEVLLAGTAVSPGRVGLAFQRSEDQLFLSTVIEDVAYGPLNNGLGDEEARAAAESALRRMGLSRDLWDRPPATLSGGERRRAAIAGIMAMAPEAYILDEPTSGLDGSGRQSLHAVVRRLARAGVPVVVISHDLGEWLPVVDRVVLLRRGRLAYVGPVAKAAQWSRPFDAAGIPAPYPVRLREEIRRVQRQGEEREDA